MTTRGSSAETGPVPGTAGRAPGRDGPATAAPVLVTGSHRSGTTWVGTMLGLAPGAFLVPKEPFNPNPREYALGGLARHWFTYAPQLPQDAAERAYRRVLTGRSVRVLRRRGLWTAATTYLAPWAHPRLIVHDPIAAFSSEWLAHRFGMVVLVLVRHPAAFAASLRRIGWAFDFDNLLAQQRLVEDHLEPFAEDLRRPPADPMARAGLLWACIYTVLLRFADRNPDWLVRTHEGLARMPQPAFRSLYRRLDLTWNEGVAASIHDHTAAGNPARAADGVVHQLRRDSAASTRTWKADLTPDEVRTVRSRTDRVAARFYDDASWSLSPQ